MLSDLRFALRSLSKTPGFTLIAVLTIALGIGLNTSMFTVLKSLVLRPLPYPQSHELVRVYRTITGNQGDLPVSPPNFTDLRASAQSFAHFAAAQNLAFSLAEPGQPAARVLGLAVTEDFFSVLGVAPAAGRPLQADDFASDRGRVVVLTHRAWQSRFGADPALPGREIRLDGEPTTVVGILPAAFDDARVWGPIEFIRPFQPDAGLRANRGANFLHAVARLAPGASLEQAQADLATVNDRLAQAYPDTNSATGTRLVPLHLAVQDPTSRTLSWFTFGLAGCVLLIACANLANLLFARNALRSREHAVRAALGATRLQLVRQSLAECLVLAAGGGLLGLLIALWANDALGARLVVSGRVPLALPIDYGVLAFAFGTAAFAALAFGLLPALFAARVDINEALKQGTRGTAGSPAQARLRRGLIVGEVALALVLLTGAGFFIDGLLRFTQRDLGWRPDRVLTGTLALPAAHYGTDDSLRAFYDRLESRLAALPGVERVGLSLSLPFNGYNWQQRFLVEGRPDPAPGTEPMRAVNLVNLGFFAALGLPLVEGRTFTASDHTGDATAIVINETMAREIWPGESAVGRRLAHPNRRTQWQQVVGVVRDVHFATNVTETRPRLQTYRLMAREPDRRVALVLRTTLAPEALVEPVRRLLAELDPDLPLHDLRPASHSIERGLSNFTTIGALLVGFATLGLFLAALGLYGLIAGFVAQRHREFGVRVALGATAADVLRLVFTQGLALAVAGLALGALGTYAVRQSLITMIPAFPQPQWIISAALALVLLTISALACWLPAQRATKVNPIDALRSE